MKYASIPVFIPHLACGNDCVFCNQRKISGAEKPPGRDIYPMLEDALLKLDDSFSNVDIAFFGGSFTGIPREEMIFYLTAAKYFKERDKRITGIRLSTRPDYISKEILDILKSYGVTAVELGAQSMCDEILRTVSYTHLQKQRPLLKKQRAKRKRRHSAIRTF